MFIRLAPGLIRLFVSNIILQPIYYFKHKHSIFRSTFDDDDLMDKSVDRDRDLSLELFSNKSIAATKKNPFGGSISRLSISQPCSLIDRDFASELPQQQQQQQPKDKSEDIISEIDSIKQLKNKTDEEKLKSLTTLGVDDNDVINHKKVENVTSVEVSWAAIKDSSNPNRDEDELTSLSEEERKRDRVHEDLSEKDEGSVVSCSSVPVDFGDSLPPNLTTLVNKRFCLYRLNKAEDTELGVLITKKLNRDRRTSGEIFKQSQKC